MIELRTSFQWHGDQARAEIRSRTWAGIQRAVVFLWTACQHALNVSNPRPYQTPSAPGQPPRKRTGFLAANVLYDLDEAAGIGRVGVAANARYGLYLELGTRRMAARPWLLATVQKVKDRLAQLIGESG